MNTAEKRGRDGYVIEVSAEQAELSREAPQAFAQAVIDANHF
jgi:hypothetical protein